jgi:hypothetical protein
MVHNPASFVMLVIFEAFGNHPLWRERGEVYIRAVPPKVFVCVSSASGAEFQCSTTRPDIPYTLYVGVKYLLLVPREVTKVHRNFPAMPDPPPRYRLQLSDYWTNEYKSKYNSEPTFHYKYVEFGLEDDEVVVAALLDGSNLVPHWEFRTLFKGDSRHLIDQSSDAKASFEMMQWDLSRTAVAPDA